MTVYHEFYFGIGLGVGHVDRVWVIILPFVMFLIEHD